VNQSYLEFLLSRCNNDKDGEVVVVGRGRQLRKESRKKIRKRKGKSDGKV
jgi:hypothetical protein